MEGLSHARQDARSAKAQGDRTRHFPVAAIPVPALLGEAGLVATTHRFLAARGRELVAGRCSQRAGIKETDGVEAFV